MQRGRRVGGATVVAALVGLFALAGCSNSPGVTKGGAESTSSTSAAPTTSILPSSTSVPLSTIPTAASAVLDAYRAAWAATEKAGADADPLDPGLKATMVDPLLHEIQGYLVEDNQDGEVGSGSIQLHPHVVSISATSAVVEDCSYSNDFLIYKKTGKQVPPVSKPESDGVRATLVREVSTWKVSQRVITEGSCPAGY
jgi:hypothetical protein